MLNEFLLRLTRFGRLPKRAILIVYDLVAMAFALWAAFSTRLGVIYFPDTALLITSAAVSFGAGVAALYWLRVYHIVLRYFDLRTVARIFSGTVITAAAWVIAIYFTDQRISIAASSIAVPRSVGIIYCGFLFLLLFMGRYLMALLLTVAAKEVRAIAHAPKNIIIYGVNAAGISLADSVRGAARYRLIAFVDDDPALRGQLVAGVQVYSPSTLPDLVSQSAVTEVFLALPKASRTERLLAISALTNLNLKVKTVPAPEEIASGRFTISDVRPVDVSDLLRRETVEPMHDLIREAVSGNAILVTGAGGSIGAEICRQILRSNPTKLVLLDHSEFALFTIHEQLSDANEKLPLHRRAEIVPVMGSMLNGSLVRKLIETHRLETIYHAAAYKHVPLLEQNELVGVENNVLGTLTLAQAALDAKITRFIMISTDKAVRPTSVMGASKRAAELIIQSLAHRPDCKTRFGIVRFGNVLDSSGSVVQRFRNQIERGEPVTVTHREITRFFMSIPEATQLVLQASALARHGEVFVLDMGEPVKIADLARNMIGLSGMSVRDAANPDGDISIEFTGLRPGEKLFEELFIDGAAQNTVHPRIKMARERFVTSHELDAHLSELISAVKSGDPIKVRMKLSDLVRPDGRDAQSHNPEANDWHPLGERSASYGKVS